MVNATRPEKNWASHIKHLLYSTGFGFVWEQQSVKDTKQFIVTFTNVRLHGAMGKALGYRSGGQEFEPCQRTYTLCIVD